VKLYSYWRSSAAFRVRIALNLKGLAYETVPVHLLRGGEDGGPQHRGAAYRAKNPQMRVPALETDDGEVLIQSLAILEWLEETHPEPPLLPRDALARAKVRAVASIVACDIHPVHNSGPLAYLRATFGAREDEVQAWVAHWMTEGFAAIERLIDPAPFAFGPAPTLADVLLTPQVFGARRFAVPLEPFPKIRAAVAAMEALDGVKRAMPAAQPDAEG
jgi:maleylacetoacetate isomerase